MGSICVFAEQWNGAIPETSFEALAMGRELADALGLPLEAILLGAGVRKLAASLGAADAVLMVEHPALADPVPAVWADALAQAMRSREVRAILLPLTNVSLGVGTVLASRLEAPVVNFCKEVTTDGRKLIAHCVMYGGKIEVAVEPVRPAAIFCLWPGARPPEKGHREREPRIEPLAFSPVFANHVRFKQYLAPAAGDIDITHENVLVAVGRGVETKENLAAAEELAGALGGAVCASRPVVDQGWLPLSRQVGKSGMTVKPRLYVALGISGAPEHVEGMKTSDLIVAINTDPKAPIFSVAHYGIVAGAVETATALAKAVKAQKAKAVHA
jgi:electron transfer flavoprotein alpha subunit